MLMLIAEKEFEADDSD
uniref:Uncharacterized protein n=1 Tax=Arundo donax TaxID=35708 RepID=A0A0A8Y8T0_ARUDO